MVWVGSLPAGLAIGRADTGVVKQRYTYDPYGNVTQADTSAGFTNPYQFTGREADTGGLYYYRARYYSPGMGRFISEDPAGFAGGQNNFYGYVGQNPSGAVDPSGLLPVLGLTSADMTCMQAPQFCAEIFGDWARSEGTILAKLGAPCAEQAGEAVGNLFDTLGKMAMVAPVAGGLAGSAARGAAAPAIKAGAAGGETAGKAFPQAIKDAANAENPLKVCVYCRREGVATQVDHAIPKARGGNATLDNAQLACPHCNASKGARDFPVNPPPDYFGQWPPSHW